MMLVLVDLVKNTNNATESNYYKTTKHQTDKKPTKARLWLVSVTLFPDLNGFEKWSSKAKELSHIANFTISDLLERKATEAERKQGFDLADYLIKFDYKEFLLPEPETIEPETIKPETIEPQVEVKNFEPIKKAPTKIVQNSTNESWEQEITELENYFAEIALPTQPVQLKQAETIFNCSLFIESHFATVKTNNGNKTFLPHLNRLQELKQVLTA